MIFHIRKRKQKSYRFLEGIHCDSLFSFFINVIIIVKADFGKSAKNKKSARMSNLNELDQFFSSISPLQEFNYWLIFSEECP